MSSSAQPGLMQRAMRILRPSHQHTAYSATLLLMATVMLSRIVGSVREIYVAWAFGAGPQTDAYVAAFTLPDFLNYILAGGTTAITFVAIYTRFLANQQEERADRTFSAILSVMAVVLVIGIVLLEIFAPQIVRVIFPNLAQPELCVHLTRILLPAQLFFYVGGVISAVLLSHRMFLVPSMAPIIYNGGIIAGGVVFSHHLGIGSLAIGAVAGAIVGPFLINALAASRTGIGFALKFDISDPGFREWIRKTIPLMLGVSLVTADDWILRYFASGGVGDITRLNYAKRLFMVPMAVLGQAAGAASLPFFARLFNEKKLREFAASVSDSVYRISASSMLLSAWMAAVSLPAVDLFFRVFRGRFHFSDSQQTAVFFMWFGLSLAFWSAQAIYSRAFYAAGDTLTPMIATSAITVAVIPIYSLLFHSVGITGLAMASDIGIVVNTVAFAILLNRKHLVPATIMRWKELAKCVGTSIVAGILAYRVAELIPLAGSRVADVERLALGTLTWAAAVAAGLWITKSNLPRELQARKATPNSAPAVSV